MKTFYLLIMTLFIYQSNAQSFIDSHFQDVKSRDDITEVVLTKKLFDFVHLFGDNIDIENEQVKNVINGIESFHLVSIDSTEEAKSLYLLGKRKLGKDFEHLIMIKNTTTNVDFMIREESNIIKEVVCLIKDGDSFTTFCINGHFKSEDIERVSELGKIQETFIPKVVKETSQKVKIYPNPISQGNPIQIEVEENMIGGKFRLVDSKGGLLSEGIISSNQFVVDTPSNIKGSLIIEFVKDDINIKKTLIVIR